MAWKYHYLLQTLLVLLLRKRRRMTRMPSASQRKRFRGLSLITYVLYSAGTETLNLERVDLHVYTVIAQLEAGVTRNLCSAK